jgi:hypothetical protein
MAQQASRWLFILTLAMFSFGAVLMPALARAEPTEEEEEEGRELAKEAMGFYKDSDFEQANASFEQARAVYPSGQVLRMSGYTLMALEKWLDAAEMLEKALAAEYKPLLPRDAEHAQDNLKEVMTHIVVVEVISGVAGAQLSIDDGDEVALPHKQRLEPGTYQLRVTAEDHRAVDKEISVSGGESVQYKLSPKPMVAEPDPEPVVKPTPKPEPDEPTDMFGWFPGQGFVGLGAAGVGLVMGIVGIGVGSYGTSLRGAVQDNINAHNTNYDVNCSTNRDLCLSDIELINRDGARAKDFQTAGLGLGITGAILFAAGTTLFLFSDMSPLAPADDGADGKDKGVGDLQGSCDVSIGGFGCAGTF